MERVKSGHCVIAALGVLEERTITGSRILGAGGGVKKRAPTEKCVAVGVATFFADRFRLRRKRQPSRNQCERAEM